MEPEPVSKIFNSLRHGLRWHESCILIRAFAPRSVNHSGERQARESVSFPSSQHFGQRAGSGVGWQREQPCEHERSRKPTAAKHQRRQSMKASLRRTLLAAAAAACFSVSAHAAEFI
ncbi:MAG: hypothetical protein KDI64_04890, partial [Candidatus Accumulibacter sp.]|nr:hypothetical protein [Accumulibacter sp.]